jgi:hypothetical protein
LCDNHELLPSNLIENRIEELGCANIPTLQSNTAWNKYVRRACPRESLGHELKPHGDARLPLTGANGAQVEKPAALASINAAMIRRPAKPRTRDDHRHDVVGIRAHVTTGVYHR